MIRNLLELLAQKKHRNNVEVLRAIVLQFRRAYKKGGRSLLNIHFNDFLSLLKENFNCRSYFKNYINELILQSDLDYSLTELGISPDRSFVDEFWGIIKRKVLPEVYPDNSLVKKLNRVFGDCQDYIWLNEINEDALFELFTLLEINHSLDEKSIIGEKFVYASVKISAKIAAIGVEKEVNQRLSEIEQKNSPFIEQHKELILYLEKLKSGEYNTNGENDLYKHLIVLLNQCIQATRNIDKRRVEFGTSLDLSYSLNRLTQLVNRLKLLLQILHTNNEIHVNSCIELFKELVKAENQKNSLKNHLATNVVNISNEIVKNEGATGEHYITNNRSEYKAFFISASIGGGIVAILALIKFYFHSLHLPIFWEALLYSLNYGFGFVVIHLVGATLATKQPAMTASTLANALQIGNNKSYLPSLAILIVKVFRSQFIAFVGNLVFAFPVAFLISSFFGIILGVDIFTELDAEELKQDLMPFQSLTFFYAAIAGVYLFLAGIISGYYDNSVLYNNIPKRVEYHPVLSVVLGRKLSRKLANYISHNLGSLVGNFSLGVMLGTAAAIGQILGLPYDIRHITFTTAQFGFAYYAHPFIFDFKTVLFCIFTILGIGFFNFAISFGLAFYTATRARFITFKEANTLFKLLIKYFYKYPFDFLFPPKKERVERDLV